MSASVPPPINPYQSPVFASEVAVPPLPGDFFRDGKFLVFRDRAELPLRCLANGEEVTADAWRKRKQVSYNPPWVFIGLVGGVLPLVVLILIAQKKAHIVYSLGQKARSRIRNRQLLGSGCLLLAVGLILAGVSQLESGSNVGTLLWSAFAFLTVGVVIFISASPFKISGHNKGWFKMKGVSEDILNQLPERDWKSV